MNEVVDILDFEYKIRFYVIDFTNTFRFVTYHQISREQIIYAIEKIKEVFNRVFV